MFSGVSETSENASILLSYTFFKMINYIISHNLSEK